MNNDVTTNIWNVFLRGVKLPYLIVDTPLNCDENENIEQANKDKGDDTKWFSLTEMGEAVSYVPNPASNVYHHSHDCTLYLLIKLTVAVYSMHYLEPVILNFLVKGHQTPAMHI